MSGGNYWEMLLMFSDVTSWLPLQIALDINAIFTETAEG